MRHFDQSVFHWINHWPDAFAPFFYFMSEATKILPGRLLLLAVLVALIANKKTRAITIVAVLSWPIANGVTDLFKAYLPMARPSVDYAEAIVRNARLTSNGTASAHSANMACIAAVFWRGNWRWGAAWGAVAFFTGLSRIYNGVHYPSQVLLGWTVGALVGLAAYAAYRWVLKKRSDKSNLSDPSDDLTPDQAAL